MGEPAGQPVTVTSDAYEAVCDAHAVCILTEWEEFRSLDCRRMYNVMQKPAFVFAVAGFIIYAIGKPLDQAQWLKVMPAVA